MSHWMAIYSLDNSPILRPDSNIDVILPRRRKRQS